MTINKKELLSVVTQLTEDKYVRVAVTELVKGGCIAATTTALGGLFLGPIGLAVGGVVGGCTAALMSKDKLKPISQVIMQDMTDQQRAKLLASVMAVIKDLDVTDARYLLMLLNADQVTKEFVLRKVFGFIQDELKLVCVN